MTGRCEEISTRPLPFIEPDFVTELHDNTCYIKYWTLEHVSQNFYSHEHQNVKEKLISTHSLPAETQ